MMEVRVMVIGNHESTRKHILQLLETDVSFIIAGNYSNISRAAHYLKKKVADVVVINTDVNGAIQTDPIKNIKKVAPLIHILIITALDDLYNIYVSVRAGASGYLLKKHINNSLINSIRDVTLGGAPMSPEIAKKVLYILRKPELIFTGSPVNYQLTSREKEILSLLKDGLSYKMIMGELNIKYETVRSHMKNIYDKLSVSSLTEVVAKVITEKIA